MAPDDERGEDWTIQYTNTEGVTNSTTVSADISTLATGDSLTVDNDGSGWLRQVVEVLNDPTDDRVRNHRGAVLI